MQWQREWITLDNNPKRPALLHHLQSMVTSEYMIAPYGQLSVAVSMTSPSGKSQQRKSPKCTWLSLAGLWITRRIGLLSYFLRCGLSIMLCRLLLVSAKQRNESNSTFDCSILSAKKYWTVSPVKPFSRQDSFTAAPDAFKRTSKCSSSACDTLRNLQNYSLFEWMCSCWTSMEVGEPPKTLLSVLAN